MPTLVYYGNGVQTRFEVPGSVKKTVLVGGIPAAVQSSDFQSVTLVSAPGQKVPVQIDWDADGKTDGEIPSSVSGASFSDFQVDCIASGLALPTTGGLSNTVTSGVAYLQGARTLFSGQAITLAASSDNYIDALPTGLLQVSSVGNGAGAPAVAVNGLRLGYVVTGASTVSSATTTGKDSLGNWMGNRVRTAACILGGLTAQTITGATNTQITFSTAFTSGPEIFDNLGVHSTSTNTHRIPIQQTGLYQISGEVSHGTGGGSPQILTVRKNADVAVPLYSTNSGTAASQCSAVNGVAYLVAGDFIYLRFNSATAVSLVEAYFSAVRVG